MLKVLILGPGQQAATSEEKTS